MNETGLALITEEDKAWRQQPAIAIQEFVLQGGFSRTRTQ
jgi:hypothetical protein